MNVELKIILGKTPNFLNLLYHEMCMQDACVLCMYTVHCSFMKVGTTQAYSPCTACVPLSCMHVCVLLMLAWYDGFSVAI